MTGPNEHVYIHELIDITGHHRADYVQHMAANWSPLAQETRGQKLFGIWSVIGSTGPWPAVVNLWEEQGFGGLARSFAGEAVGRGAQDPALERWWAKAADMRRGGFDRLVRPAPWSPPIDELCARAAGGALYLHETVRVRPGANWELLELARSEMAPVRARFGIELVGAFATVLVDDDECILLWSVPTWDDWARFEDAHRSGGADDPDHWRRSAGELVTGRHRILLVDAPLSPLRTGRQPTRDDQVDWSD